MRYRYRIYHSEEGKARVEQAMYPFTEEQQVREYSLLPSYLSHCLHGSGIIDTCVPAANESNGVIVELASDMSEDEIDSYLAKCLVELNHQVKGLCLVIEKLAS